MAASSETNGTRGEPLLWQCTLSKQFDPQKVSIYWQNQNNTEMLHYYRNGKEDLEHQSLPFKNRTKIFPDQLRSGNLSLIIDPLMHEDNLKSLKVVFNHAREIKDKLCQTMVHVAGWYLRHFTAHQTCYLIYVINTYLQYLQLILRSQTLRSTKRR